MDGQMAGQMTGQMMPLSSLSDGDPLIYSPFISFPPFRESFRPCHGCSRCILRDGHLYPFYLPWKEKTNIHISVRAHHCGVGGGGQEVALSVADTPLVLPHIPPASSHTLGCETVAFL
jgi:hypothetical protein